MINNALLQCNQGTLPCPLTVVTNLKVKVTQQLAATINDHSPASIKTFGLCRSPGNPAFAATGVPQPCTPTIPAPWAPPCKKTIIMSQPALADNAKCFCVFAGEISVSFPGQELVEVS